MSEVSTPLSLDILQQRILAGETLSADEYKEVINQLRSSRSAASATAAKRGAKKSAADFDLNAEIDAALGL